MESKESIDNSVDVLVLELCFFVIFFLPMYILEVLKKSKTTGLFFCYFFYFSNSKSAWCKLHQPVDFQVNFYERGGNFFQSLCFILFLFTSTFFVTFSCFFLNLCFKTLRTTKVLLRFHVSFLEQKVQGDL